MSFQDENRPKIVIHPPPEIEMYIVTEDELKRIEEQFGQTGQSFAWMLTGIGTGVSALAALATGSFDDIWKYVFVGIFAVCLAGSAYMFHGWRRHRRIAPRAIAEIRARRSDPER